MPNDLDLFEPRWCFRCDRERTKERMRKRSSEIFRGFLVGHRSLSLSLTGNNNANIRPALFKPGENGRRDYGRQGREKGPGLEYRITISQTADEGFSQWMILKRDRLRKPGDLCSTRERGFSLPPQPNILSLAFLSTALLFAAVAASSFRLDFLPRK